MHSPETNRTPQTINEGQSTYVYLLMGKASAMAEVKGAADASALAAMAVFEFRLVDAVGCFLKVSLPEYISAANHFVWIVYLAFLVPRVPTAVLISRVRYSVDEQPTRCDVYFADRYHADI